MQNDLDKRDATQQLNAVLDNLLEFVVRWLPDGIRTYVNKAYCDYYRLSKEDALGTSFFPHIAQEDLNKVQQRIARLSITAPCSTDSHRVYRPDGTTGWQEWTDTAIYDDEGNLVEYQSVGRDITKQKQAEEEQNANREQLERLVEERTHDLEITNKELESFSYSVSHDLRAPLRTIDGFCSLLLEQNEKQLDEVGKDYLQRVRISVSRMSELIDALLGLAHVSRTELKRKIFDMSAIVSDIATQLSENQKDRVVEFDIQENVEAIGDAKLLQIALDNLIENAWKYTINTPNPIIHFGVVQNKNEKIYFIRDNGIGFDMKNSEKLFSPFRRLPQPDNIPGTGIGLATVSRIILRHGGKIWAEADVNKGATFYFTLGKQSS